MAILGRNCCHFNTIIKESVQLEISSFLSSRHLPNNPKSIFTFNKINPRFPNPSHFYCRERDSSFNQLPRGDLQVAEMRLFSGNIFTFALLLAALLLPTVRSNPNLLQLPSDRLENDLCPLNLGMDTCPVKCFRPDPVCGADGVTYWCGCAEAVCAGARVKKFGFCEVGNGGSGPAGQALLLVHIIWLILLGVFVLFGLL